MSKDNREECPDCLGHEREIDGEQQRRVCEKCLKDYGLGGYHVDCVDCLTNCCTTCDGTGEVTIDSGADVCEWEDCFIRYTTSCDAITSIDLEEVNDSSDTPIKYCPYCGKPITIKGE